MGVKPWIWRCVQIWSQQSIGTTRVVYEEQWTWRRLRGRNQWHDGFMVFLYVLKPMLHPAASRGYSTSIYIGSGSYETKLLSWDRWDQQFLHETSHQNTVKVKTNSNIHSKNIVKVTFTEFFDVKVRFFVTFKAFSLWRFELFICYLHSIFVVNVSFLPRKSFLGIIRILFIFTVFCSEVSCVKPWSHAVLRKQFSLTWT